MMKIPSLPRVWQRLLSVDACEDLQNASTELLARAQSGELIYPQSQDWYRALEVVRPSEVRVVILGQDPYHGKGQAHGIAFSVPDDVPAPPSLRNILKELESDLSLDACNMLSHDLTPWLRQGVLLLNSALTVADGDPGSHLAIWERVTDGLFDACARQTQPIVFVLWGAYARKKAAKVVQSNHCVIESAHPSPLSAHRGFFGSAPFSQANTFLERQGSQPIDWLLPVRQPALI